MTSLHSVIFESAFVFAIAGIHMVGLICQDECFERQKFHGQKTEAIFRL